MRVIDFPENRGKRAAMAAGIRASVAEVIVFVDSDSVVEPDALRRLVQPLADRRVGAVCGHADVLNLRESWLTRMQAVRYFVAFRVVKAAESVFNAVTCCSGCFSAYRREAILPRMEWWENQTFLGIESTFGDDRSLTNCVLRDWRIVYEKDAVSHTIVPSTFRAFVKQQTRWKRSWTRESLLVGRFIWRKHPVAAFFTYLSIILPLIAPAAAIRAIVAARARRLAAAGLSRRDLRAGDGLLALLRPLPGRVQPGLDLRDPVRLLLPRHHALADLLRDRHLPHGLVGDPAGDRRHGRGRRAVTDLALEQPPAAPPAASGGAMSLRRGLAMLVLPASLLPIMMFGPGLLRTPLKIGREWESEVQRIEQSMSQRRHPPLPEPPLPSSVRVSLGPVYGHWSAFPQAGRQGMGGRERPGGQERPGGSARPEGQARPGGQTRPGGPARLEGRARPGGRTRLGVRARVRRAILLLGWLASSCVLALAALGALASGAGASFRGARADRPRGPRRCLRRASAERPSPHAPQRATRAPQLAHAGDGRRRGHAFAELSRAALRAHRGADSAHSLVLRVTPGRLTTFTIQARYGQGGAVCVAALRTRPLFRVPGGVTSLRVLSRAAGTLTVGWRAARPGDAPIAGYRVKRDGEIVGETHGRSFSLRLSSGRSHRVSVAAVDIRGHLGPSSNALVFGAQGQLLSDGAPPGAPGALSASEVGETGATIWWLASAPGDAPVAGYRVYRDGALVGQTTATHMRLGDLAFPGSYAITVAAIDADHEEGPRTSPLTLSTAHTPPNPPALLSAVSVGDTSATLSWQAGSVNGGTLVGYLLFKDGEPVGVIHGQVATVALASEQSYTFSVRTLDSDGYLSAPTPELTVLTTHTPPSTPGDVRASAVTSTSATISWSPSTPVSGEIVGYRVFRDDIPVAQTPATELSLEDLAPSSEYSITVTAVDSLGAISAPSEPLTLHTAEPTPTHGRVQAFLLASTDQSFQDLEDHYEQIGVVYPTYFNCGVGGQVLGENDPLVTGWSEARRIAVMPRVNCQNVTDEDQILEQPEARSRMIEELASLCETYGYQGMQIDFEGAPPSERANFTAFITALAEKLHSQGEKLSTIVTAKYYNIQTGRAAMYDDAALSIPSDFVFVLDWGVHWTTSGPGSIDEYPWFKKVAEYTATLPNRDKFVLGMPMYGIDWANGGGPANPGEALEYSEIMARASELGVAPNGNRWRRARTSPTPTPTAIRTRSGTRTDSRSASAPNSPNRSGWASGCGTSVARIRPSGNCRSWAGAVERRARLAARARARGRALLGACAREPWARRGPRPGLERGRHGERRAARAPAGVRARERARLARRPARPLALE